MTNETGKLIHEYSRPVEGRPERLESAMRGIAGRLSSVQEGLASMNRSLDLIADRVERIDRRLYLVEH